MKETLLSYYVTFNVEFDRVDIELVYILKWSGIESMFSEFRFWHFLTGPQPINQFDQTELRGFNKRVLMVGLLGVLLFVLRELWGMNTEQLTPLLSEGSLDTYSLARIVSLIGAILWSLIYMAFHFFGIAYLLHKLTSIPYRNLLILQLFVTALLLMEKAVVFIIFALVGYTTPVSLLSFGPLAATFMDQPFFIFFFNQLSIVTALIIGLQFRFIRAFAPQLNSRNLLLGLIGLHVVMALLTAAMGYVPFDTWFAQVVEGGASNE
ncbi:hypothetical protein [Chungangia koreensis]|uniref:hypothetical protein n=1 Tax=Chungangia koreensis TaxID=752657 RepID=UPI0036700810